MAVVTETETFEEALARAWRRKDRDRVVLSVTLIAFGVLMAALFFTAAALSTLR